VKKVRIETDESRPLAAGLRARNVTGGEFHHFEILRRPGKRGPQIDFEPVSVEEAMERVRRKAPVVQRVHQGAEFVCSVSKRDTFAITKGGKEELVVVGVLAPSEFRFHAANDARRMTTKREAGPGQGKWNRVAPRLFFEELKARKVTVTPTGQIRPCRE
jgi:hypothetical protein